MKQYKILEANMDRLTKKLDTIRRKCQKYGCDFYFNVVDTCYQDVKLDDGSVITAKYDIVEAEGTAVINNWKFVGTIEHHAEGNIIRNSTDLVVPSRYYNAPCVCEHCNKIRPRKDTYLVYNEETEEFKQVGHTCLQDFTSGMSAELVAQYIALFDVLIQGDAPVPGCHVESYFELEDVLCYALELCKHFGYIKNDPELAPDHTTKEATLDCLDRFQRGRRNKFNEYLETYLPANFAAYSEENKQKAQDILSYFKNADDSSSDYIHNLKIIASEGCTSARNLGYAVSMVPSYRREVEKIEAADRRKKEQDAEKAASQFVGTVGDKLSIDVASAICVYSSESIYGMQYLYKFVGTDNNVYMWSTSNWIEDTDRVASVKGSVKDHEEFRGVKQTILTRCKVILKPEPKKEEETAPCNSDIADAVADFLEYCNA